MEYKSYGCGKTNNLQNLSTLTWEENAFDPETGSSNECHFRLTIDTDNMPAQLVEQFGDILNHPLQMHWFFIPLYSIGLCHVVQR